MPLVCALTLLLIAQLPLIAQGQLLHGQVMLVDENGITTPATAGVEVTVADARATDRTDGKGLFSIQLPRALQPGSTITIDVVKPGWAIWQPEEGKTPLPQGLLTLKLLPKGSKNFWTDHFIQSFIENAAEKAKLQVKASTPGEAPKPVDFAPLIRDWATKYGFTPEEAKAQIEKWAAEVENAQQDFYKLGLAAFADHNFRKAGDLLSEAGQNSEKQLKVVEKQKAELDTKRLSLIQETIRNFRRAGDARYSDYAFADALVAYQKAFRYVDRASQSELWAQIQVEVGLASDELGKRTEGAAVHQYLAQAVDAYRSALAVRTREQLPQDWAMTQNNLAQAYGALDQWSEAAQSIRNVLLIYPNFQEGYRTLATICHEHLLDFAEALATHQNWLKTHPDDLSAQADLAESLFTAGQFSEAILHLGELENNSAVEGNTRAALRAIEIASLIAQHQTEAVPAKLRELIAFVSSQPADFKVNWTWNGTLHFVQTDARIALARTSLESFFKALQGENRDTILASLRLAAESLDSLLNPQGR